MNCFWLHVCEHFIATEPQRAQGRDRLKHSFPRGPPLDQIRYRIHPPRPARAFCIIFSLHVPDRQSYPGALATTSSLPSDQPQSCQDLPTWQRRASGYFQFELLLILFPSHSFGQPAEKISVGSREWQGCIVGSADQRVPTNSLELTYLIRFIVKILVREDKL